MFASAWIFSEITSEQFLQIFSSLLFRVNFSNIPKDQLRIIHDAIGKDYLNTIVPYNQGLYYDLRPSVNISDDSVLQIDSNFGFNPNMGAIKRLWDQGKVAIINGIGYPQPNRSHFRSMDIWHTAEPEKIGTEGWLGRVIR